MCQTHQVCEEPNAIAVATADAAGKPSVRIVLLKAYDERGFVFYTNYGSRKGAEMDANGNAAFTIFWEALQRSVRVEGKICCPLGMSKPCMTATRTALVLLPPLARRIVVHHAYNVH